MGVFASEEFVVDGLLTFWWACFVSCHSQELGMPADLCYVIIQAKLIVQEWCCDMISLLLPQTI